MSCRPEGYLLGLHFRGKISLGTQYASGTDAKPTPISVCAAISLFMLCEPGAMAAPMSEINDDPTRMVLRAWKVSEAEEMTGPKTAWTSEREFGTHVCVCGLSRLSPIQSSCVSHY